jgi:hypothetical protein
MFSSIQRPVLPKIFAGPGDSPDLLDSPLKQVRSLTHRHNPVANFLARSFARLIRPKLEPRAIHSENKSREQVCGVVRTGIPTKSVIVRPGTVEPRVAGVLNCEIDVLLRPPGKVENVSSACGTSIPAARDRAGGKERRVRCSGCVEQGQNPNFQPLIRSVKEARLVPGILCVIPWEKWKGKRAGGADAEGDSA